MGKSELFDLEQHFAFYGAYHSNPINVMIHMTFVWPNFFTALVFLHFTPSLFSLPPIDIPPWGTLVLNVGFLLTLVHAVCFICLDKKAGTLAAIFGFMCWVGASFLATYLGFSLAWKVVLATHAFCWFWQLLGHGVFEKRSPAFMDRFVQSFIMAPFFVVVEYLQKFFGYEPYPGFHSSVKMKTDLEIEKWQARMQKKMT